MPGSESAAQSNARWMCGIYSIARQIGAEFLIPFCSDLFASYYCDVCPNDIVAAYSQRTQLYYAFASLPSG